jgi:NAD(P)-dependent dehydrogenase (short-subunit alcohol dehydrogenase family)
MNLSKVTDRSKGLTRALAGELGAKNVRVNVIVPGYIETDMTESTWIFSRLRSMTPFLVLTQPPTFLRQRYSNVQDVAMTPEAKSEALNSIPLKRFGQASEIADAAVFLVTNQYANNCVLNLDGGLSAT